MLLTITTTHQPATDLGYLLYKHPDRFQTFDISYGKAHVFYTEATAERCTAALLLELDPVALVRSNDKDNSAPLAQYVNDRPYVASSFFSVAINQVFGTALSGNSRERPDLVRREIPLEATLAVVPCRGGDELIHKLFEPLGYEVFTDRHPLDPQFPQWGESRYWRVTVRARARLTDLLSHLYVLLPVLDGQKHYWVGEDELEKLLRHGDGWLEEHPHRELVVSRYLGRRRSLVREALDRLRTLDDDLPEDDADDDEVAATPRPVSLGRQRMDVVTEKLVATGAGTVLDLGCGEGKLVKELLGCPQFSRILAMDVSHRALEIAARRLKLDRMAPAKRERLELFHGSLFYRDERIEGCDAAAVVEVIEHLDPERLEAFERVLFGWTRPRWVVLTTPNAEYNVVWDTLPAGEVRHPDHRFEWSRTEFGAWITKVCEAFGYRTHELFGVGVEVTDHGHPTQGVVLCREES